VPEATPYTLPDASTVAMEAVWLDHVPPVVISFSAIEPPAQTLSLPRIGYTSGSGFTVRFKVLESAPQGLFTI
jgi:hypothetical protein